MTEDGSYVIEVAGDAAGLVVKDGNRFRFYSAGRDFSGLDRTLYRSPAEAEEACRRVAFPGRAPRLQAPETLGSESRRSLARYIRQATLPYRGRLATS